MNQRCGAAAFALSSFLFACGGDAPAVDAGPGIDGDPTPDAPGVGAVTVDLAVTAGSIPAGTRLLFLGRADEVVADIAATPGEHTEQLAAGGSVVLYVPETPPSFPRTKAYAWLGVEPGANLRLAASNNTGGGTDRLVTVPTVAGATQYVVSTPCSFRSSASPMVFVPLDACGATTDVYVSATGPATLTGGGSVVLKTLLVRGADATGPLDLSGETMLDPVPFALDVTGVPGDATGAQAYVAVTGNDTGWSLASTSVNESAPFTANSFAVSAAMPMVTGAFSESLVTILRPSQGLSYRQRATLDYDGTLDLGALPIPAVTSAINLETSSFTYTTTGAGSFSLAAGEFNLDRPATVAGPSTTVANWEFVARLGEGNAVHIPRLPAAYAEANLDVSLGATGVNGEYQLMTTTGDFDAAIEGWFDFARTAPAYGTDLVGSTYVGLGDGLPPPV
ncbi:MAG: hypothetical protein R2939_17560 [Kofleriaceae bacterium]